MQKFTDQQLMLLNILEFTETKNDNHYVRELGKEHQLSAIPWTNTIWFQLQTKDGNWIEDMDFYANSMSEFLASVFDRGFTMGYDRKEGQILDLFKINRRR